MNQAHLHLMLNHIPVFTTIFGVLALAWAMIKKSKEMKWASVLLFIATAVSAWIASETGEGAEDIVETLAGVTKELIHEHEEAAEFAEVSSFILAVAAILMMYISKVKAHLTKKLEIFVLILGLLSITVMARTAYLGGMIRHTEIREGSQN